MSADTFPLLARASGEPVAIFDGRVVVAGDYAAHVQGLRSRLPEASCIINLCEDRYRFMVGFGAALTRGLPTLLPPNPLPETLRVIREAWPGSLVLVDRPTANGDALVVSPESPSTVLTDLPQVSRHGLAAVLFTSGSTGPSMPNAKTWGALVEGMRLNLPHYLGAGQGPSAVVATVPAQHMYGLETTVMPALHGPVTAHAGRPFYPADVLSALQEVPSPRVLVSTPVHLRALVNSGLAFPQVSRILSATAPIEAALAAAVERTFGGELIEVYGCTEVGSMASRRTSSGEPWRFFRGLDIRRQDDVTWVQAPHLPAPVCLPDQLEFAADGSFELVGRDADLIKVGGKRGSLAEVNRRLAAVRGVEDAVAFSVDEDAGDARLAALFVSATIDADGVRAALNQVLDPAFIPRPMLRVAALPRSATGKLSRAAVLDLLRETLASVRRD